MPDNHSEIDVTSVAQSQPLKRSKAVESLECAQDASNKKQKVEPEEDAACVNAPEPRLPKRKVAILMSYVGTSFNGMQANPGVRTIEGTLFDTLCKIGAVSADNADSASKVNLSRAARTDAGVHAAGNVISMKLILNPPNLNGKDLIQAINDELPSSIKIWDIRRTLNGFSARTDCAYRRYEYRLPTYLLMPPDDPDLYPAETRRQRILRRRAWTADDAAISRLKDLSQTFCGTHNFWNYTTGKTFKDPSSKRLLRSLDVSKPQVIDGQQYISVFLHGQSFLLHMIRRMIGMLTQAVRHRSPITIISTSLTDFNVSVPRAPSLGLLLTEPLFTEYSRKIRVANDRLKARAAKIKKPIEEIDQGCLMSGISFDEFQIGIDTWKAENIYASMDAEEREKSIFSDWIDDLDSYQGPDFSYFIADNKVMPLKDGAPVTHYKENYLTGQSADQDIMEISGAEAEG